LAEKIATIAARQVVGDAIDENTDLERFITINANHRSKDFLGGNFSVFSRI
jgi:hypothetical protein